MCCKQEEICLCCGSKKVKHNKARFSDFIVDRVFDGNSVDTSIVFCEDCGFEYSSYRFNDSEIERLYYGYRNSEYQIQRQKFDAWYTPVINELIGKNPIEKAARISNLRKILNDNVQGGIESLSSVLDYGGDKGQFIPEEISNKFVYDISNIDVENEVTSINPYLTDKLYDLIMCCHVLEHVVNPMHIVEEMSSFLKPNGYLYVELPYDLEKKGFFDNFYYLFNKYYSWKNILKYFLKTKMKPSRIISEHINFYTPKSIEHVPVYSGYKILHSSINKMDLGWNRTSVISVLAKKL